VRGVRGIFRSDDKGRTWTRVNDDDHQYAWTGAAITGDPRVYGRVYVATNGRGVIVGDLC
jgi:xyloglucan-specific exo-beta-1,4-glucanase